MMEDCLKTKVYQVPLKLSTYLFLFKVRRNVCTSRISTQTDLSQYINLSKALYQVEYLDFGQRCIFSQKIICLYPPFEKCIF